MSLLKLKFYPVLHGKYVVLKGKGKVVPVLLFN